MRARTIQEVADYFEEYPNVDVNYDCGEDDENYSVYDFGDYPALSVPDELIIEALKALAHISRINAS